MAGVKYCALRQQWHSSARTLEDAKNQHISRSNWHCGYKINPCTLNLNFSVDKQDNSPSFPLSCFTLYNFAFVVYFVLAQAPFSMDKSIKIVHTKSSLSAYCTSQTDYSCTRPRLCRLSKNVGLSKNGFSVINWVDITLNPTRAIDS